jgi:hypothetical protein
MLQNALKRFEPLALSCALLEVDGFTADPGNEFRKPLVSQELLWTMKFLGQFTLAEKRVDLSMTDRMEICRFTPTLGFGNPVVGLQLGLGDHTRAQGADLGGFVDHQRLAEQFLAFDPTQHASLLQKLWTSVYFFRR